MKVKVLYFSLLRDASGKVSEVVELGEGSRVRDLLEFLRGRYPKLRELGLGILVAVNGREVREDWELSEGDEVALMPPASGGGTLAGVIEEELDLNKLVRDMIRESSGAGAGALVMFVGFVKDLVEGVRVKELDYEAYEPMATKKLSELVEEFERDEGVVKAAAFHRVGDLKPGDITIYVAVTAVTRKEAFKAAAELLERIKHEVPIFKLERREDGDYWVVGDGARIKKE